MPLFDDFLFDGSAASSPVPTPPSPPDGYLGRFQVGQSVPLAAVPVDGGGFPTAPDAAPTAAIHDPDGDVVGMVKLARDGADTRFAVGFFLGIQLPLGTYTVTYSYLVAGAAMTLPGSFDVIPGGDPGGAVISMVGHDRPEARYVVAQLSSGRLVQGRNPRIS